MTSFGQKRQLAVPLVVNEYEDGKFKTLFVAKSTEASPHPASRHSATRAKGDARDSRQGASNDAPSLDACGEGRDEGAEDHGMEQVIANGLYLGAQYALIALGLTLIFALMNVLNFAHGQMYVLGGFVTYEVYGLMKLPFVVGAPRLRR